MNMKEFALFLCEEETGDVQVNIAQMKEILRLIAENLFIDADLLVDVLKYGQKSHNRSSKRY